MSGRIITARHGCPDVDRSVRITAEEYGTWWANYDLAGLAPGQEPPQSLLDIASECALVLSSDRKSVVSGKSVVLGGRRLINKQNQ